MGRIPGGRGAEATWGRQGRQEEVPLLWARGWTSCWPARWTDTLTYRAMRRGSGCPMSCGRSVAPRHPALPLTPLQWFKPLNPWQVNAVKSLVSVDALADERHPLRKGGPEGYLELCVGASLMLYLASHALNPYRRHLPRGKATPLDVPPSTRVHPVLHQGDEIHSADA